MSAKEHKSPLVLDMDFDEALRRFAQTDPDELPPEAVRIKEGGRKPPPKPKKKPS